MTSQFDVTVRDHGHIVYIISETDAARNWVAKRRGLSLSPLCVEPDHLDDLLVAMAEGGLRVPQVLTKKPPAPSVRKLN